MISREKSSKKVLQTRITIYKVLVRDFATYKYQKLKRPFMFTMVDKSKFTLGTLSAIQDEYVDLPIT